MGRIVKVLKLTLFRIFYGHLKIYMAPPMPTFGRGRYLAVGLHLRDNNKPIHVLNGIDYWLGNLICNLPEFVMGFHVNGIIQKYEMVKTEKISNLENSIFLLKS